MVSNYNKLPFLLLSLLFLLQLSAAQNVVKSGYWLPESEFPLSDINSNLFTHLFCAFADIDNKTNQVFISQSNLAWFSDFTKIVKLKNPNIKTLLSIGGWYYNSSTFTTMASQASSRKTFINSSISLARKYDFSGLDLEWLFPLETSEMTDLSLLLDDFRAALKNESANTGLAPLNLTAGVNYATQNNGRYYPTDSIARNLDWINLIAYDFYNPDRSNGVTQSHSALYDPSGQVSGSFGVEAWIQAGLPAKKLVLGIPFYGYAYRLVNPNNHGLYAPANGWDTTVVYESFDATMEYNQIKAFIREKNATTVYNATIVSDYCYKNTTWIGYDDIQSISTKVRYAKEKGLLGYSAWHVGADYNWALSQKAYGEYEDEQIKKKSILLVEVLLPIAIVVLLLGFMMCYIKRRLLESRVTGMSKTEEPSLPIFGTETMAAEIFNKNGSNLKAFSFAKIKAATNNFSTENKLGEGGYGPVYKGNLSNGQEIAVKRLSKTSHQGLEEFKNEVMLTAKLQHVNLVKVLGYCIEKKEKTIIYEYMPNKSLDLYLFDPFRRFQLDWRKYVHIIEGVTQGLLYLQEYSNFTIIHRDLKGSNILLDNEMNPKISDFAMARIFSKNELEANTDRIVGTYGYVPPEYVRGGIYSMKYDVYSFGVLLLQIISGKRNTCSYGSSEDLNLLDYAYGLWQDGKWMEFIDPSLDDSSSTCKLNKCLQIALLCLQEDPVDRPTMLQVYSMLKNDIAVIATPKMPAFSTKRDESKENSSVTHQEICSVIGTSFSEMLPR